jgi:hypothetical protein
MNADCIGSQDPKWTVVLEKKEEEEEKMSPCVKYCFQCHLNV